VKTKNSIHHDPADAGIRQKYSTWKVSNRIQIHDAYQHLNTMKTEAKTEYANFNPNCKGWVPSTMHCHKYPSTPTIVLSGRRAMKPDMIGSINVRGRL
jgi:hypothetical protein